MKVTTNTMEAVKSRLDNVVKAYEEVLFSDSPEAKPEFVAKVTLHESVGTINYNDKNNIMIDDELVVMLILNTGEQQHTVFSTVIVNATEETLDKMLDDAVPAYETIKEQLLKQQEEMMRQQAMQQQMMQQMQGMQQDMTDESNESEAADTPVNN